LKQEPGAEAGSAITRAFLTENGDLR